MNRFCTLLVAVLMMLLLSTPPCALADELSQTISRETGDERLSVHYPSPIWDSGQIIDFSIWLSKPKDASPGQPTWHIWASEIGTSDWRELPWINGKIHVPEDMAGLYQVKVSPEVAGDQSDSSADYIVRELIAIRRPNTRGTLNLTTPGNRVYFARGEPITVNLIFKCPPADRPRTTLVRLVDSLNILGEENVDTTPIPETLPTNTATAPANLPQNDATPVSFTIPEGWTHRLRPGRYVITASSPNLTVFHQTLVIGAGRLDELRPSSTPRFIIARCDALSAATSVDDLYTAPDRADTFFDLSRTLGFNLYAPDEPALGLNSDKTHFSLGSKTMELLRNDPRGFSQEEATMPHPVLLHQSEAATEGMRFIPMLPPPSPRAPTHTNPETIQAIRDALDKGTWNPSLDQATADLVMSDADADHQARTMIPASLGAYLGDSLSSRPDIGLFPWSKVTRHAAMPGTSPNNTIPTWLEIETPLEGDGLITSVASILMRPVSPTSRANLRGGGVGFDVPAHAYDLSAHRALGSILKAYGPLFASLQIDNRIAIIDSHRMALIDRLMPESAIHAQRIYEAYHSFQFAHHPATVIDTRTLKPDSLVGYRAIILVDQRVDLEPELKEAIRKATASGAIVYCDATCQPAIGAEFRPLGLGFNHMDRQPFSSWSARTSALNERGNAAALLKNRFAIDESLGRTIKPPITVDSPEVWATQWTLGQGRFVLLVNNTLCPLPDAQLDQVGSFRDIRMPVRATVKLDSPMRVVYDVLAMRKAEVDEAGQWTADFRNMPARLFAILPEEIYALTLGGPRIAIAGMPFRWNLILRDRDIQPIDASVPIRLCLKDDAGNTIDERYLAALPTGTNGVFTAPINTHSDSLILEATELFSGRSARLRFKVQEAQLPLKLTQRTPSDDVAMIPSVSEKGTSNTGTSPPAEASFGPRIGSMTLLDHDRLAVVGAGQWGPNVAGIDTSNGRIRWSKRIGHFDVASLQRLGDGFAGIGLDFNTPEQSHIYIGSKRGELIRRFTGRPDHASFAAWPDASWVASAMTGTVAAWTSDGVQLWASARTADAPPVTFFALDGATLLCVDETGAWAVDALSGRMRWKATFAMPIGDHPRISASRDGKTIAITGGPDRGRVMVIRDGAMLPALMTQADDVNVSPDGMLIAVTIGYQLKAYSPTTGLQWIFHTDSPTSSALFSPDAARLFVATALGTIEVLDTKGKLLWERDMSARTQSQWLANGNLLLGTANGWISLLDAGYREIWSVHLAPFADDSRSTQFPAINLFTVRPNP